MRAVRPGEEKAVGGHNKAKYVKSLKGDDLGELKLVLHAPLEWRTRTKGCHLQSDIFNSKMKWATWTGDITASLTLGVFRHQSDNRFAGSFKEVQYLSE